MARRPTTALLQLCDEVGIEHLQATELFRRIKREIMEGKDILVVEFGTFYRRDSKERIRRLNGVDYTVPERSTVALRGPRFPATEQQVNCKSLIDLVSIPDEVTRTRTVEITANEIEGFDSTESTATFKVNASVAVSCLPSAFRETKLVGVVSVTIRSSIDRNPFGQFTIQYASQYMGIPNGVSFATTLGKEVERTFIGESFGIIDLLEVSMIELEIVFQGVPRSISIPVSANVDFDVDDVAEFL